MKNNILILYTLALIACSNISFNKQTQDSTLSTTKIANSNITANTTENPYRQLDENDNYNFSKLGIACRRGDLNQVKKQIEEGADISDCMSDDVYMYDAIFTAIFFQQKNIV